MPEESRVKGHYPLRDLMIQMAKRVEEVASAVDERQAVIFLDCMLMSERIFVIGAGRSGFVAKAYAMRLMHLGFEAYVVGETVTPSFHEKDTLVAFSGSGKTKSIIEACEIAKKTGGTLCLITGAEISPLTNIADHIVHLRTEGDISHNESDHFYLRQLKGEHRSIKNPQAPIGTLFETSAMVFSDSIISALIEMKHFSLEEIKDRYTNMQ